MSSRLSLCGVAIEAERYLIARRNPGGSQGGKWEFPGGKQEVGETSEQTLIREFLEELGVGIVVETHLYTGHFYNGDKRYEFEAWQVKLTGSNFILNEHQEIRWVTQSELLEMDFSDSDFQVARSLSAFPTS